MQGNTSLDFGVLKYAPNGTLVWTNTWNGQASGMDIPADLDIDDSGDIYLVGGSESSNTFSDYAIVKFNANGQYLWHTTYDYTNLHDAATSLAIHTNTLVVSGASASTLTDWDYATLEINKGNGNILNEKRTIVQGVGLDNVVAVTSDGNNNTYITGYTEENGNRNIQTLKINSNFDLEWVKNFDGGLEDVAKAIGVDDFGNIYIVGTKENGNGGKEYITIKYDQNGNELWNREFGSNNSNIKADAEHLAISNNGNVFVTGTIEDENSNKEFATLKYSPNGELDFAKRFNAGSQENEAKSIVVNNDDIYVTGITISGGISQNTTIKYKNIEREIIPVIIDGEESYVRDEIIVQFGKSSLNLDVIDRKSFVAGNLNQFIKPEIISQLNDSTGFDWANLLTFKIHKGATSLDTLSYTRLGDTISLPPFWGQLVIKIPNRQDQFEVIKKLKGLNGIYYAQINHFYSPNSEPNDPAYTNDNQLGYHSNTIYPNSDINVLGAWNFLEDKGYSIGSSNVKVGVFDHLIDYTHPEFDGTDGVANSKIKYGKNYNNGNLIVEDNPRITAMSHGTSMAGLIGANRNNDLGIAGIAGGDFSLNSINQGVALYSIGLFSASNFSTTSDVIVEAIIESSVNTNTGYGNGLNISNHSYGSNSLPNNVDAYPDIAVRGALINSWQNGTVNIAARGNKGSISDGNSYEYPACYDDKTIINVIASGTDGKRKTSNNGDTGDWESSYGRGAYNPAPACYVDVMAPGVMELVSSTVTTSHYHGSPYETSDEFEENCNITLVDPNDYNNRYSCVNGTSAATAHVSGVAALMYSVYDPINNSVYPNKLTTEDIEHVIEKTTFKTSHEYDHDDGYGLINAEEAVRQVILPYYVYHLTNNLSNATITEEGTYNGTGIYIKGFNPGPISDPNSGSYDIDGPFTKKIRYKARWNINYIPTNGQIIDWWKVYARSYGGQAGGMLNATNHVTSSTDTFYIQSLDIDMINNEVTGTVDAYYYKFIKANGQVAWWPSKPNTDIRFTIALHIKGDDNLGIQEEVLEKITVYPNPSGSEITIKNIPSTVGNYNLNIFDISGRLIETKLITNPTNKINVMDLSNGLYYLRLEGNNFNAFTKFIKQ